jgi:hypothetical protein
MSKTQIAFNHVNIRLKSRHAAILLLTWVNLTCSSANATTQGETALINSSLPHEKLGANRESTRLQGYVESFKGHVAMLDELKADVQSCVRTAQFAGRQARPPQTWPDYVHSTQSDTYDAANRTITYATTLLYTYDHADCSLVENRRVVAKLASNKGFCDIDLVNKKAHGVCDARGHADAQVAAHPAPQALIADAQGAAANAPTQSAMVAMEKAMKQFGPVKTGEHKMIAGIECDVLTHALGTDGTACLSRGGSFPGWHAGPGLTGFNRELELSAVGGLNARAVKAQLDASVNPAVFAPYLAGGFQITDIGKRK